MNNPQFNKISAYCPICDKNHEIDTSEARVEALQLMDDLKTHKRLDFDTPIDESDPRLSTDILYERGRGEMFGILLCEGVNGKRVTLKAFSSQHNGLWDVKGWAPPIPDISLYKKYIDTGASDINSFNLKIASIKEESAEWHAARQERRNYSRELMKEIHKLYEIRSFGNRSLSLKKLFEMAGRGGGIPNGSGDCCAPKLLNEAQKLGLNPLSLVEFFWGESPASKKREEGCFYHPCREKCEPIIGFMLCGGRDE